MKNVPFSLAAVMLLASCSGNSTTATSADPTALVKLSTAQSGGVASTQVIYGTVGQDASSQFMLSAPIESMVVRIAAPAGTSVTRGQLVVELMPSPSSKAAVSRLSAEANAAQLAYERAQRLRADGLVSESEVESARAAAQSAHANRAALSSQSSALELRAPGSGYVQSVTSSPGELVSAGTPMATISRSGTLRARFGIDPNLIGRISRNSGVRIPGAQGDPPTTLQITSVDPSADPQTRLASVYASVPAALGAGTGQPLSGEVTLEQSSNAATIPYQALLDDGGQPYVFIVTNAIAHRRDVELGASNGAIVAIVKGVKVGDSVVTEGGTALDDGTKVRTK